MSSAHETLREAIASLSENEAMRALEFIRSLRNQARAELVALFADDPSVHIPDDPFAPLPPFKPVDAPGVPASEMINRDRR